jgi:hypothetical protein
MTKIEIKKIISEAVGTRALCRVNMKYDRYACHYYPLKISNKLFLAAVEDDFILDGFTIRCFRDVKKAEFEDNLCAEINRRECIFNSVVHPDVDLTDWRTVFMSLQKFNRNIIIESENDLDNEDFYIGRIEKVSAKYLLLRYFDADGKWNNKPDKIKYSEITTVQIATRYADVFSKYLPPLPENFGR